MATTKQALEHEFCPPLDPSLLAALFIDATIAGEPSDTQIDILRSTLKELADQAELEEKHNFVQIDGPPPSDIFSGASNSGSDSTGVTTPSSSVLSHRPFSSSLEFLQAALPNIPVERLECALDLHPSADDRDMAAIIENLLTDDYLRELEERGLDGTSEADGIDDLSWENAKSKRRSSDSSQKSRKHGNKRRTTFTFGDVRQTQRRAIPTRDDNMQKTRSPVIDPWTQLTSLSTHIASLLPPHPPSFFQSFFHSPEHPTPYNALLAALHALCTNDVESDRFVDLLPGILDILLPSYDPQFHPRLISEIQLALNATQGRGEDTLDLVKLLRDLDLDTAPNRLEMGFYHSPLPTPGMPVLSLKPRVEVASVPASTPKPVSSPSAGQEPEFSEWQSVPYRKTYRDDPNALAAFIPAYRRNSVNKGDSEINAKGWSESQKLRRRVEERMRKRKDLLRQASEAWKKGSSKTRGGDVAFYYAERARECYDASRRESLEASRWMVESKRMASHDGSVDLHGVNSAEAITIVKEILQTTQVCSERPLRIVTGRGTHSVNKVSVLKPAVKNALVEDGWIVDTWDGGLFVRGKRPGIK